MIRCTIRWFNCLIKILHPEFLIKSAKSQHMLHHISGVVRGGRGAKCPRRHLPWGRHFRFQKATLRAAFSVQKSNSKGGIFGSKKQFYWRHFRFKKATLKAAFSVQKSNPGGGIFGSRKQPWRRHFRFKKATQKAAFSVQKSKPKGGIFGSNKQH